MRNFIRSILFLLPLLAIADPHQEYFAIKKMIDDGSVDPNIRVRYAQLCISTGRAREAEEAVQWIRKNNVPSWDEWATAQIKILPMLGQKAPDFQGKDFDAYQVKLSDYEGRVLLMHFWTSADLASPDAITALNELVQANRSNPYFTALSVALDKDLDRVKRTVEMQKWTWAQMHEAEGWNSAIVKSYKVQGTPTYVVIDGLGVVRYVGQAGQLLNDSVAVVLGEHAERVSAARSPIKVTPMSKDQKMLVVAPVEVFNPTYSQKVDIKLKPGTLLKAGPGTAVPGMVSVVYNDPATGKPVDGLIPVTATGN